MKKRTIKRNDYTVKFYESFFDGKTSKDTLKKTKHFVKKENAYKWAETMQANAKDQFSWIIYKNHLNYQGRGYHFTQLIDCKESKHF